MRFVPLLFALAFAACAYDNLPSEPSHDVAGAPSVQELTSAPFAVSNNNDPVHIGSNWLQMSVECMAATYPNDYFEFTSFTAGQHYVLTSHDHQVEAGYWYTQGGALNIGHIYTRINSPSAPWIHRSYVWSLVQQASEPDGGRVDFMVGPPNGSQQIARQASCDMRSLFGQSWAVMSATIPGN